MLDSLERLLSKLGQPKTVEPSAEEVNNDLDRSVMLKHSLSRTREGPTAAEEDVLPKDLVEGQHQYRVAPLSHLIVNAVSPHVALTVALSSQSFAQEGQGGFGQGQARAGQLHNGRRHQAAVLA
jgi:hypothetical protein